MTSKLITFANLTRFKQKLDDAFEAWEATFNTWKTSIDSWKGTIDTWKGTIDTWKGTIDSWKDTANTDINNLKTGKQDKLTAGDNITISNTNVISAEDTIYELPIATTDTLGGIKPDGTSITVDENGIASASGGSGASSWNDLADKPFETLDNNTIKVNENGQLYSTITPYTLPIQEVSGTCSVSGGTGEVVVQYPTGYNMNNCIVISFASHNNSSSVNGNSYGYYYDQLGWTNGSATRNAQLIESGIKVMYKHPSSTSATGAFSFKIYLLKIS